MIQVEPVDTTESDIDEALVERTMKLLLEHDRKKAEGLTLVGEHVIDEYFGGDAGLAQSKRPTKDKSFARLTERAKEETSFKKRTLYRAVTMAIVWRSVSPQVREKLEPTHLEELGSIDDVTKRREIAVRIAAGELSGKALRAEIAKLGKAERAGGRPAKHAAEKMGDVVERALEELETSGELGKQSLRELGSKGRRGVGKRLRALAKRLGQIAKQLEA